VQQRSHFSSGLSSGLLIAFLAATPIFLLEPRFLAKEMPEDSFAVNFLKSAQRAFHAQILRFRGECRPRTEGRVGPPGAERSGRTASALRLLPVSSGRASSARKIGSGSGNVFRKKISALLMPRRRS
jgi:hypothetical protein